MSSYYLRIDDRQIGPYTEAEILAFVREGKVRPNTLCLPQGYSPTEWKPVKKYVRLPLFSIKASSNPPAKANHPQVGENSASEIPKEVVSLTKRYKDAYLVARATNGFGGMIKAIGIVIAILLVIGGFILLLLNEGRLGVGMALGLAAIIFGIIAGIWFYIVGVLVSAQGQILKASLDTAVNTSPVLAPEHKARIMSL